MATRMALIDDIRNGATRQTRYLEEAADALELDFLAVVGALEMDAVVIDPDGWTAMDAELEPLPIRGDSPEWVQAAWWFYFHENFRWYIWAESLNCRRT